jgi:hypothetical protein
MKSVWACGGRSGSNALLPAASEVSAGCVCDSRIPPPCHTDTPPKKAVWVYDSLPRPRFHILSPSLQTIDTQHSPTRHLLIQRASTRNPVFGSTGQPKPDTTETHITPTAALNTKRILQPWLTRRATSPPPAAL